MSGDIRMILISSFILVTLSSFILGVDDIRHNPEECVYNSIGLRINIPYVVGCELFRRRFK